MPEQNSGVPLFSLKLVPFFLRRRWATWRFLPVEVANDQPSNLVDIYDAATNQWRTATLSRPRSFLTATTVGQCQFDLGERHFDYDFPGHYCRQIKSISISIPAVVGPYQNIKATLTQLSDKVLVKPDSSTVDYLLGKDNATMPDTSTLRSSWRRNQKIALSQGVNDSGLFELNFRDERYLPFEGTGAVSTWELSKLALSNSRSNAPGPVAN